MNKIDNAAFKNTLILGASAFVIAALVTMPSQQATAASESDAAKNIAIEEILVTAQKRTERLIDVPMSVVAIGGDALRERQITSIDDLPFAVPGMSIQNNGFQRRIQVRGISNVAATNTGNNALIGVYLDEADVTGSATTQLPLSAYDLERVEVLRGPQGTLYGGGAAGGTIRFITRKPELGVTSANIDAAVLFTKDGEPSQRFNAMVNLPVVSDELAVRIAGTFEHQGGWINQPAANKKNYNSQNLTDVRFKALWQPTEKFSVNATADIHRSTGAPTNGEDANGNYQQFFDVTDTPSVTNDFDLFNVTAAYDFDSFRILSTTTYVDQQLNLSNLGYALPLAPPPAAPFGIYLQTPHKVRNFNEEARLSSTGSGPWQWTLGGYYRHFRLTLLQSYEFGLAGPLPGAPIFNHTSSLSKAWAIFGDTSYALTDRLTVGAGVRYYRDNQDFVGLLPATATQTGTFDSVSPRGYVQYKLTDDANVYASAAKGFRSGGFNSLNQPTFNPETVWTYELGTKMSLLDGRLSVDTALFYSEYTGYQIIGFTAQAPVNIASNAGDARIKGLEGSINWKPVDDLTLSFSGSVQDSKFYKITAASTAVIVGDEVPQVPDYSFTVSAQRDFTLVGKPASIRVDYSQFGKQNQWSRNLFATAYSESDVIYNLNVNASVNLKDNLRLSAFVENLTNCRGLTDTGAIFDFAARARPRTFGIQVAADF